MPSVSIIIPTHNRGELLMQTVASVRAQTVADFEVIVVDDHSTDDTAERMKPILEKDARFRMITVPDGRSGAQAARNIGIEASAGRYVILLDSDDLIAPHCLEQRLAVMGQHPELDFAVFPCECFRKSAGDVGVFWNIPTDKPDLDRFLEGDVPWQTTSPIWKREAIVSLLPWPENVPVGQDWEFHIRAIVRGLKYGCFGTVDHFWRMAESERESIGKRTMKPELLKSRVTTNEMVLDCVRSAGQMNDLRRTLFAGLFFQSAERIGTRCGWRDGLAVWERARQLDLITDRQLAQGKQYFWMYRFKSLRPWLRGRLQRAWPKGFFVTRSETYLSARIVGATPASPAAVPVALSSGDACVAPTQTPAISVIMSAYNNERYLRLAIDSIVAQTFGDFEFIIIDDGSKDSTLAILRDYESRDKRFKIISRPNKGLTVSLNEAISHARAPFIARMDGDDIAMPDRFEKQIAYMNAHPECVLLGSRVDLIDPFGGHIALGDYMRHTHAEIDAQLLSGAGGSVVHPAAMMRASALKQIGGYREQYNNSEDLDLFLRLAEVGQVHNLTDVLLQYRRHPDSVSHQKFENQWKLKRQIIADAYARRGMVFPDDWTFKPWQPKPHDVQFREWGWQQLKAGHVAIARKHAWEAIKRSRASWASWRLMFCALRGR